MEGIGANLSTGIPARIFYSVMRLAPSRVRMRMWRGLYQRMARSQKDSNFRFMNYGFTDGDELELSPEDEGDRLFIQLYNMNIRDVEIEGKEVLEVGSGRGGGASWISRKYNPKSLLAVDYSDEAIRLSQGWFSDQDKKTMEKMHQNFVQSGFTIESWTDVTQSVVDALDIIDEGRREMIRQSAPPSLRKSFETFGGVPGTPVYEALKSGRIQYFRYLLCKPE